MANPIAPSITQSGRLEPFELQVSRTQIFGHTEMNVQGYNVLQHDTFRAVWELSNTTDYVFPTGSLTMAFTSTLAETLVMRVDGLDSSYATKTAIITFTAGTTGVVTSGTADFFRINAMQITQGASVGNITAANGGVTYAQINAGAGRSQASIYTVPAGYTFFLSRPEAFSTNNGGQLCTYRVFSQTFVNGEVTPSIVLSAPFQSNYSSVRVVPRPYLEKTDIQWQLSQSVVAPGSIQLEGILIKNDGTL